MKRTILFFAALIVIAGAAPAAVISVNLNESSGRRPMTATDLAGANGDVRVANWNNLNSSSSNTILGADMVYDNGNTIGGTFQIDQVADHTTYLGETTYINDQQMYAGYSQQWNDESVSFTVTDIPFDTFDIYIYVGGDASTRGGSIAVTGQTTYYNRGGSSPSDDGSGYTQITTTSYDAGDPSLVGQGNYVHYEDLSLDDLTITIAALDMGDSDAQRMRVTGFQIVEVPEPTTMGLLGLGGLALLRKKRRTKA